MFAGMHKVCKQSRFLSKLNKELFLHDETWLQQKKIGGMMRIIYLIV